jgi:hypothetical protein
MPNESAVFFLWGGKDGADFAFIKELESPDYATSVLREVLVSDLPDDPPADLSSDGVVATDGVRTAGFMIRPTDPAAAYQVTAYGWHSSEKTNSDDDSMADFYAIKTWGWIENLSGNHTFDVDCQRYDGFVVVVDALSAGKLDIEQFVVQYESAD